MSDSIREKWDNIYSKREEMGGPAVVVAENLHLLPASGTGLEIACGLAGNSFAVAAQGITMEAWDISPVAVEKVNRHAQDAGLPVGGRAGDITQNPPDAAKYDVIVASHFLERKLFPMLIEALKPGGLFFYQTFTQTRVNEGGPSNPEWLLADNELLQLCDGMQVLFYREEGKAGDTTKGTRNEAMIVARKPD